MPISLENRVAGFVKVNRQKANMTQEDLAERAGVGLRFIRELEQGKTTLRLDKVNQVLQLFGYTMSPGPERIMDPWEIHLRHVNRNVRILLKNKTTLYGFLLDPPIMDEGEIKAWKFVTNNKAKKYQDTENGELIQTIPHAEIENIENI